VVGLDGLDSRGVAVGLLGSSLELVEAAEHDGPELPELAGHGRPGSQGPSAPTDPERAEGQEGGGHCSDLPGLSGLTVELLRLAHWHPLGSFTLLTLSACSLSTSLQNRAG
jgi:hypothetical protein